MALLTVSKESVAGHSVLTGISGVSREFFLVHMHTPRYLAFCTLTAGADIWRALAIQVEVIKRPEFDGKQSHEIGPCFSLFMWQGSTNLAILAVSPCWQSQVFLLSKHFLEPVTNC